jgi:hypothetical protein
LLLRRTPRDHHNPKDATVLALSEKPAVVMTMAGGKRRREDARDTRVL